MFVVICACSHPPLFFMLSLSFDMSIIVTIVWFFFLFFFMWNILLDLSLFSKNSYHCSFVYCFHIVLSLLFFSGFISQRALSFFTTLEWLPLLFDCSQGHLSRFVC
eukprot:GCRY01006125.1.p1 GENE.GCRY01006125.1~~GCRY01006125.1.p1  ORF type:complete len:106 (-),score=5.07 GCRY01006125.1:531-848(-)